MKKYLLFFSAVLVCASAASREDIVKKETIRKDLTLGEPLSARTVVVDNVFGSVEVKGVAGNRVRLVAERTVRAGSDAELAKGMEEVRLDIIEGKDGVEIIVDGPFRREDGSVHFRGRDRDGYSFSYDMVVEVPSTVKIDLSTINDGDITVSGMHNDFDVENVNGGIEMRDMKGSGKAYALNEDLTVGFSRNPEGNCRFGSLNGEVKIYFQSPFSADLRIKTFNGGVFSDFPVTYPPRKGFG